MFSMDYYWLHYLSKDAQSMKYLLDDCNHLSDARMV